MGDTQLVGPGDPSVWPPLLEGWEKAEEARENRERAQGEKARQEACGTNCLSPENYDKNAIAMKWGKEC